MQPFTSVLSDPMLRNGYALIASATVTQVLGVAYWIVAARTAPAAVVGRNSAAIYMMLFLAGVAELNLMSTLVRFLPTSGRRAARLIVSIALPCPLIWLCSPDCPVYSLSAAGSAPQTKLRDAPLPLNGR